MAVNNESLYARVQNQLSAATICNDSGSFDTEKLTFVFLLADSMSKTNTPSRGSEYFFELISFHANLTFRTFPTTRNQTCLFRAAKASPNVSL